MSQAEIQAYLEKHGKATVDQLVRVTGLNRKTLYSNLKRLRGWGYITVENPDAGVGESYTYTWVG